MAETSPELRKDPPTSAKKEEEQDSEDEHRANEPLAVVACMIRLGFCLDLTEPENIEYLAEIFDSYKESMALADEDLPRNTRKYRKLDRAVFEYAYKVIETEEPKLKVDTARGVYVPTDVAKRIWEGSWISRDTHIQLCVRNPASLLGVWLYHPIGLEVKDVCQASKLALPSSSQKIRKAKMSLRTMTKARRIELMVEAGVMTPRQAAQAKKKLSEIQG